MSNYRPKEEWIKKGATVKLSGGTGILKSFTEANIEGKRVVLSVSVQRIGVNQAFPFNAWDIEPITQ